MVFKGLYRKAAAIRDQILPEQRPAESWQKAGLDNLEYNEEEELLKINALIAGSRREIKPETFHFKPQKNGSVLPLLINLVSFLFIIAGSFVLVFLYNQNEQAITGEVKNYRSNESSLLTVVKEELSRKEAQISDIQQKMQAAQQEKDQLKREMEVKINLREQELELALEKELAAKKNELIAQGLATRVVEQMLQDAENQKEREKQQLLSSYSEQLSAEIQKKEADYSLAISSYQEKLNSAQQERTHLADELAKSRAEQQKLQEQELALQQEHAQLAGELTKIQELRQKEGLVLDQINSYYSQVYTDVRAGRYTAALQTLSGMEEFLTTTTVMAFPAVQQRRATDLLTIQTIRKFLAEEIARAGDQDKQNTASDTTVEQELLARQIREKVIIGETFFQQKNYRRAFDNYIQILDYLDAESDTLKQLKSRIQAAGHALTTVEVLANEKKEAVFLLGQVQKRERERQTLINQLTQFKLEYTRRLQETQTSSGPAEEQMVALLEAKVLVKQIISSEPVRSRHPELYELLENYFQALSVEQRQEGQRQLLAELVHFMENLEHKKNPATLKTKWSSVYNQEANVLLLRFLTHLEALLR